MDDEGSERRNKQTPTFILIGLNFFAQAHRRAWHFWRPLLKIPKQHSWNANSWEKSLQRTPKKPTVQAQKSLEQFVGMWIMWLAPTFLRQAVPFKRWAIQHGSQQNQAFRAICRGFAHKRHEHPNYIPHLCILSQYTCTVYNHHKSSYIH